MRDFENNYVDQKGKLRDLESKNKEYYQNPKPATQESSFLEDDEKADKAQKDALLALKKELADLKEASKKLKRSSFAIIILSVLLLVTAIASLL